MQLDYYLWKKKLKQTDLADYLGINKSRVSLIVNRKVLPTLPLALKIEEWTKGKVSCRDLASMQEGMEEE